MRDRGMALDPADGYIYLAARPTWMQRVNTLVDAANNNPEWDWIGQSALRTPRPALRSAVLELAVALNEPVTERIVSRACDEIMEGAQAFDL